MLLPVLKNTVPASLNGQSIEDFIHTVARRHIFDELKDHIGTLPDWDGTARADGWLSIYAGADTAVHSTEYLALIGSKYLMQTLNRALIAAGYEDLRFSAAMAHTMERAGISFDVPLTKRGSLASKSRWRC